MHKNPSIEEYRTSQSPAWIQDKSKPSNLAQKSRVSTDSHIFQRSKDRLYTLFVYTIYPIVDLLAVSLSLLAASFIYRILSPENFTPSTPDLIFFILLMSGFTLLALKEFGGYRKETSILNAAEMERVIKSITVSSFIAAVVSLLTGSRPYLYMIALSFPPCLAGTIIARTALYHLLGFSRTIKKLNRRAAIYGTGQLGQQLYRSFACSPKLGINTIGFIERRNYKPGRIFFPNGFRCTQGVSILGTIDDLPNVNNKFQIDEVYITENHLNTKTLANIISMIKNQDIRVIHVPDFHKIFPKTTRLSRIGQIPLIEEYKTVRTYYSFTKMLMDICFSIVLTGLLLPLFVCIAIAIKLDSPGPVFFKHFRVGKNGRHLLMYKFRTLDSRTSPYSCCPKSKNDPRITKVGALLRKMSLDELPQLINVLKGEMSLVGPRPEMPFIVKTYDRIQRRRLEVTPGITGLWQLSGDRTKEIHENMDYDLYYIDHQSIALDIAILMETFIYGFKGV